MCSVLSVFTNLVLLPFVSVNADLDKTHWKLIELTASDDIQAVVMI